MLIKHFPPNTAETDATAVLSMHGVSTSLHPYIASLHHTQRYITRPTEGNENTQTWNNTKKKKIRQEATLPERRTLHATARSHTEREAGITG